MSHLVTNHVIIVMICHFYSESVCEEDLRRLTS